MSVPRLPGKQSRPDLGSRSEVHALILADSALDIVRKLAKDGVRPRRAGLDETACFRRRWRRCRALGRVTFDNDPPPEGTLPADRHGWWEVTGRHGVLLLAPVVAAHPLYVFGLHTLRLLE